MSLTVREVRLGNSEVTSCTHVCLRSDEEVILTDEQCISVIAQGSFYALQQFAGLIPSAILETEIAAIAAASGLGAGFAAGLGWGIYKNKNMPGQSYATDWYYWSMTCSMKWGC
jgi:hypothetical protein